MNEFIEVVQQVVQQVVQHSEKDEHFKEKLDYHEGYYCARNNIPYDKNQTESWKEGWRDGYYSIYEEEYQVSNISAKN